MSDAFGRPLPGTDLAVSPLGLGGARIGGVFSGSSRREERKLLQLAFDRGITTFDTADIYGQGESERLIGEAFRGRRGKVVVISKVGYQLPRRKSAIQRLKPILKPMANRIGLGRRHLPAALSGGYAGQRFDPAYIVSAVEASLGRLQTDHLDVLLLHSPPAEVITSDEVAEAAETLRRQGKIRWFGISCEKPADALVALAIPAVSCVEVELSLLHPEAIMSVLPAAQAAGKGVIARQCFASGLLLWPRGDARLGQQPPERLGDLDRCLGAAAQLRLSPGAAALGFSLAAGPATTLLGAHTSGQLEENLEWAATPLTAEAYAALLRAATERPA